MNAFEFSDFTWYRPKKAEGFRIEVRTLIHDPNRPRAPEPLLVEQASEFEPYHPLDESGLFLTFASTKRNRQDVLQFAQRYGRLGQNVEFKFYPAGSSLPGALREGELCEQLCRWYGNMGQLADLCTLWEMARRGDRKELLAWSKRIAWRLIDPLTHEVLLSPERDPVQFAYQFLGDQSSRAMKGLLEPRIVWDESVARPMPKIVPTSLLGALYLQFACAVGEDRDFQQCLHCKKWFELAPGLNRADRRFCSDSCRVLAYRARQERARELAAEGNKAREIAKEIGSTVESVKKWIDQAKE
jgi:hypothetical protein